jgi:hypothetical protein
VNELGRRLDFSVENGLYQGRVKKIGHVGIWKDENTAIVVEVKTTGSYRVNWDRSASYRLRLVSERRIPEQSYGTGEVTNCREFGQEVRTSSQEDRQETRGTVLECW